MKYLFDEQTPLRVDQALAKILGKSRALVQETVREKMITVNGRIITKSSFQLKTGDEIEVAALVEKPKPVLLPIKKDLEILCEDEFFLALNKPQGLVIHPAPSHYGETLVHYLQAYLEDSPSLNRSGIVHRLDKGTSGVLLIGKTRDAQEKLSLLFQKREIKKEYEALCLGKLPLSGTIDKPLKRHPIYRKKFSIQESGKQAQTRFQIHKRYGKLSHVFLFPETGRTHQLRVHMASLGSPIVGDKLYGFTLPEKLALPLDLRKVLRELTYPTLHAKKLSFTHPVTGKLFEIEAPRPLLFSQMLQDLENG